VVVAPKEGGKYVIRVPVYHPGVKKGNPFGIHLAVWLGTLDVYIKHIRILRG